MAGSNFAKVLSGFKIVFNTLFILGFIGGLFGAGVAMGYGVALFDKAQVPQAEELVKQVKDIASISEITYSDGSTIASIEGDLLRTSVASDAISDNLKKAIVATEDEHFNEHKGVVPKAVIRATLGTFVGLGSSSVATIAFLRLSEIAPLHFSLGDRVRPCLKKKKKKK